MRDYKGYWTTKEGKKLKIREMDDFHIELCIRVLKRTYDDEYKLREFENELLLRSKQVDIRGVQPKAGDIFEIGYVKCKYIKRLTKFKEPWNDSVYTHRWLFEEVEDVNG